MENNGNEKIEYSSMVRFLKKPGEVIVSELSATDADLIHMTMGVCGESGELLDAVKKAVIYRKNLDIENVIEELGDLEFYLEGIRQILNLTRDQILEANINKLSKRYNNLKYSDAQAQERKDKQ